MTLPKFNPKYYINVSKMKENQRYPRPRLKRTIFVTGWNEWLQLKTIGTGQ